MKKEMVKYGMGDVSKSSSPILNEQQADLLFSKTPKQFIKSRTAKGGGSWDYVTGAYAKKMLNLVFGWDWDFRVIDYKFDLNVGQCFVQGELRCRTNGKEIVKQQFGRQDIKFKSAWENGKKVSTQQPLDLGNDLKGATTDCLKKCASEMGFFWDVYSDDQFSPISIANDQERLSQLVSLFEDAHDLPEDEHLNIQRIIDEKETKSYTKAIKYLIKWKNV